MNTELGFLMDLFLDDELPKAIKQKIRDRIKEVEQSFTNGSVPRGTISNPILFNPPLVSAQAPSMQKLMAQNPDLIPTVAAPVTPAAAQALAARNALIMSAGNEKPEAGRKSPRKI